MPVKIFQINVKAQKTGFRPLRRPKNFLGVKDNFWRFEKSWLWGLYPEQNTAKKRTMGVVSTWSFRWKKFAPIIGNQFCTPGILVLPWGHFKICFCAAGAFKHHRRLLEHRRRSRRRRRRLPRAAGEFFPPDVAPWILEIIFKNNYFWIHNQSSTIPTIYSVKDF